MLSLARSLALASLAALPVVAARPPAADVSPTLDTVVVTGVMPGPGLWRIKHEGRTLWILGTVSPLPRDMRWEALKVGEILGQADAVLSPPGVDADLSAGDLFKMASLARSAGKAMNLPVRQTLVEVLPSETHARWTALVHRYPPGDDKIERRRPMFASQSLYFGAIEVEGLTRTDVVWNTVNTRASELGVPVVDTRVSRPLALDRARYKAGIQSLATSQVDDIPCFTATLDSLPADLDTMKRGANAWATGDLGRLLQLRHAELKPACKTAHDLAMGFQAKPEWDIAARASWLAAADAALRGNGNTLAVLPMADLVGSAGLLATLRELGYTVVAPDEEETVDEAPNAAAD